MAIDTVRSDRTERARVRRWAQRLAELARASGDPASAEALGRALAWTERAAQDFEARVRSLRRDRA